MQEQFDNGAEGSGRGNTAKRTVPSAETPRVISSDSDSRVVLAFPEQPSVVWPSDGDEFIYRLTGQLERISESPVSGSSMTTVPLQQGDQETGYRRYTFSCPGLATALAAIPMKDGSWLLGVDATDAEQANTDWPLWTAAIRAAAAAMGQTSKHDWWAVVAPISQLAGVSVLESTVEFAGITLMRPVVPHARIMRAAGPRGLAGGGQVEMIYPVVASGTTAGYQNPVALNQANDELLILCAALTLDTGCLWEVIEAPQSHEIEPASLPQSEHHLPADLSTENWLTSELSPTEFASETVTKIGSDPGIKELLASYYHARSVEITSPSLAAVVYVSIVESIGTRFISLSKCSCCEKCKHKEGYAKTFREALKVVATPDVAKRLSGLYDRRSETAHAGTLHGTEFRLRGAINGFKSDPADHFLFREVWHIRDAAGRLLHRLVQGQLPSRVEAVSDTGSGT